MYLPQGSSMFEMECCVVLSGWNTLCHLLVCGLLDEILKNFGVEEFVCDIFWLVHARTVQ